MMKMTNNYGNGTKHRQKFKSHHLDTGRGGGVTILMVVLLACLAWLYVAGRLWQDAENRNLLFNLLEKNSGQMPKAVSVEEQLLNLGCKDLGKKIAEVETELALARSQGYLHKRSTWNATVSNQRLLAVIGIYTGFGSHLNRNRIRNTWLPTGQALKKLEEKGVVIRFVVGRSANRGDSSDRRIDAEIQKTKDFLVLESHEEAPEELPQKARFFFSTVAEYWDADFYVKVDDNIHLNLDELVKILSSHRDKPRVYIGCMKSGDVISEEYFAVVEAMENVGGRLSQVEVLPEGFLHQYCIHSCRIFVGSQQWYEPEWWKFGDEKSYFRHAAAPLYALSKDLARYININRASLQTYAHEDISIGSWMMGLDAEYIDDRRFCCSSLVQGAIDL